MVFAVVELGLGGSRTLLCSPREARLGLEGLEGLEGLDALEGLEGLEGGRKQKKIENDGRKETECG